MSNAPLISLENVSKIYRMGEVKVPALDNVSLEVNKGDFIALVGPSGSGKSTMLNLVGCLDIPSEGKVHLKSQDISKLSESELSQLRGKTIGFIFQQYHLIKHLTAYQNILLPLEFQDADGRSAPELVKKALTSVGLGDKINNKPGQLSGGELQRVAIARSLVGNPDIILADEPTGALDSKNGTEILKLLHKLWKNGGKTIIMVTHDLTLTKYATKIVRLKDGKIIGG